jgi:F0F1-type ATP synthase delta subunit
VALSDALVAFSLPLSVVSPVDLGRLIRELEALDNDLNQAVISFPDNEPKMPLLSRLLDEAIAVNKIVPQVADDRKRLIAYLWDMKAKAPVLHVSFSADPSPSFTQKLLVWLRQNINKDVLVTIGLQPSIGAGCIVRTNNKFFDLSLRKDMLSKRGLLLSEISEVRS